MMMRIVAPCRLGEQFEHKKPWGGSGPRYLVGVDLFAWHCCGFDGFVIRGSSQCDYGYGTGYFDSKDLIDPPISFEIPYAMIVNEKGVPVRELGLGSDKIGWVSGLYLRKNGEWFYRVSYGSDRQGRDVRTEELDKLFEPILPAVKLSAVDFL